MKALEDQCVALAETWMADADYLEATRGESLAQLRVVSALRRCAEQLKGIVDG